MSQRRPAATYALYRGDELLDVGTCAELAERRGVSTKTIYHYTAPAYRKEWRRGDGGRLYAVRIDDDE